MALRFDFECKFVKTEDFCSNFYAKIIPNINFKTH